jgi:hypothetical protein
MLSGLNVVSESIAKNSMEPKAVTAFISNWALKHIPVDDAEVFAFVNAQNPS